MELHCWSSDFGLPSWHSGCLQMLAYAKITGVPVNVKYTDNPFWTQAGDLPVFKHREVTISNFDTFVDYLEKECKFSADFTLDAKQKSDRIAFKNLIEEKLAPSLDFLTWIDAKNHVEFSRPWFAKRMPFPLGMVYPRRYHKRAVEWIATVTSVDSRLTTELDLDYLLMEKVLFESAVEVLSSLSHRLGDSPFFFGHAPSSLDALAFSYLAPLLRVPFPNNRLGEKARGFPNLENFVSRIINAYFPGIKGSSQAKDSQSSTTTEDTTLDINKTSLSNKHSLLSLAFAALAMTGYAYSSGLVDVVRESTRNNRVNYTIDEEEQDEEQT